MSITGVVFSFVGCEAKQVRVSEYSEGIEENFSSDGLCNLYVYRVYISRWGTIIYRIINFWRGSTVRGL